MNEEQNEPTTETPTTPPAAAVKLKKKKRETKAERLQNAAQAVLDAVEAANTELQELADAYTAAQSAYEEIKTGLEGTLQGIEDALQNLQNLRDVREEEYQGWLDNLPENLQQSPVGEKLSALLEIDLEPSMPELMELPEWEELDMSEVENAAQEILDADLPQGFGRD
jgi:chromosome segregation ATPase